ncbi:MAG: FG-GAP repeat domain-containing protein [Blastocatellia bacterium]
MTRGVIITALLVTLCLPRAWAQDAALPAFERIRYNNPGLIVDLGAGLWAWPLPLDYDGDGDFDLIVVSSYESGRGGYYFENISGATREALFKAPVKLKDKTPGGNVQISYASGIGSGGRVLTPAAEFVDFKDKRFADARPLQYSRAGMEGGPLNLKLVDYDGDGLLDLIVGTQARRNPPERRFYTADGEWRGRTIHGFVYALRNTGTNDAPVYAEPAPVQAGGAALETYGLPSPNFSDWDGDGDLDLICGEFLDKLTYFENTGARNTPRYARGRHLAYEGRTLTMELQVITPVALDWDKDGDVDLVVGQEDGRVALVENTGSFSAGLPVFLPPRFFKQQAGEIKIGALATPASVDWDGDGDDDLICGDTAGYVSFLENLNGGSTPGAIKWAAPRRLAADSHTIRIQAGESGSIQGPEEGKWGYTILSAADWNHDGLPDLVVNSIWGEVLWYENTGTRQKPALKAARPVTVEGTGAPPKPDWTWWQPKHNQLVTQWRTMPAVIDLNKDGLNDLVMLDTEGYLAFFERKRVGGQLRLAPGKRIFRGTNVSVFNQSSKPMAQGNAPGLLRLNGEKFGGSGRHTFTLVDWDLDGKLDLLANSESIDLLRGEGDFVFRHVGAVGTGLNSHHATCPTVVDWDRDGAPDLLIGSEDGYLYHLKHPHAKRASGR